MSEDAKVFIGGLSYSAEEADIREVFEKFGAVAEVIIPTDRETGKPRGFGFVKYEEKADAEEAIKATDQSELCGRTVTVNMSKPRGSGGGGGGRSGGGGYGGGGRSYGGGGGGGYGGGRSGGYGGGRDGGGGGYGGGRDGGGRSGGYGGGGGGRY